MKLRAKSIRRIASPALLEILLVEILLVGILLGAVTGVNAAPPQKERTFRASQNPRVIIDNPASGRLVIQGWDRPEVRAKVISSSPGVSVEMRKLPLEGPADRVYIVVRPGARNLSHPGKAKADLLIEIPAEVELEVRQQAGPANAEGFYGDIKIETVSGNVTVTDVGGHLALKSMSGELHLIRPSGSVEAETISGDISFIWPASAKVSARTTQGRITYEGDFLRRGRYDFRSHSGNIEAVCTAASSFTLAARTVRGKVEKDPSMRMTPLEQPRLGIPPITFTTIVGNPQAGNASVLMNSFSGTIRVRLQQ